MRVTKAQAEANRARIVETASTLFREHGFDGVGVAELMGAAGLTHGGFYKHFQAKAALIAEATASGIAQFVAAAGSMSVTEIFKFYLSRAHRDARSDGCVLAALSGDVARQPDEIKAVFALGVEDVLTTLARQSASLGNPPGPELRAKLIDTLAHAVGAVALSRACPDDSPLSYEILDACREAILATLPEEKSRRGSRRPPSAKPR